MARIYAGMQRYSEAMTEITAAIDMEGRYPELIATLGWIHGMMGNNKQARSTLEELHAIAENEFVAPNFFAEVCLALGDYDQALVHSEEFLKMGGSVVEMLVGRRYEPLRRDHRFAEMLKRLEFPDRSVVVSPAYAQTATMEPR